MNLSFAPRSTTTNSSWAYVDKVIANIHLYDSYGTHPASPGAINATGAAKTVIDAAMSQLGVPYAWGGGTAAGPSRGIHDGGVADAHGDYNKIGFDCSGLTLYAYAKIGISLCRTAPVPSLRKGSGSRGKQDLPR